MISIEVNVDAASKALGKLAGAMQDRTVPNAQLGVQLYSWTMRNFEQEGGLLATSWEPLKESTLKEKARLGYSSKALIRTGNLRQSFLGFSDNDSAGVGARASFGVDYAEVHQEGGGNVPARSMLPPAKDALKMAISVYDNYIATSREKARL